MKTNLYSPSLPPTELLPYCGDLQDWPERWMGEEKDLPAGRRIVECFTPFLLHLAASGLSRKTIQKHVDNLWILGGEIIRDVNENPSLRKVTAEQLLRNVLHQEGGAHPQRFGRRAALLRLHLPQVPPFPHPITPLKLRQLPTDSPDEPSKKSPMACSNAATESTER